MRAKFWLMAMAAVSVSGHAQAQAPDDVLGRLTVAWRDCVGRSANSFFKRGEDKSMSVEMAFTACATEEQALFSANPYLSPPDRARFQVLYRQRVKQILVGQ